MKKFVFNLQALLNIRGAREREIQYELSHVVGQQNRERLVQDELRAKMDGQKIRYGQRLRSGAASTSEAMQFQRFIDSAIHAIAGAETRIQALEPKVQEIRARLIEASREKKVVEKLRERKLVDYHYEVNRELAKEADELNQKRYARLVAEEAEEGAR